jgi:hypothetical protein
LFQRDSTGLAAAKIEERAFSEQMMPALAIDKVCCSWNKIKNNIQEFSKTILADQKGV